MTFDRIIKGGLVIDGTGKPGRRADIGIRRDRIDAIGDLTAANAQEIIDATGLVVAPGFIDTHVHSDVMLLADPTHAAGLSQGITTEILGQDGLSYAPLSPANLQMFRRYLAGLNGNPEIAWDWSSVAEYRSRFDKTVAINTAYQIPHGALRLETVGMKDAPLRGEALQKAKRLLAQAFDEGAVALSTGLSYYPCSWSDTDELVELCRVAARYGKPYVTHTRTVFRTPPSDYTLAATEEACEIGRRSGAAVHFSHTRTTPATAGQVEALLAPVDAAKAQGVDITLECYPYPTGSGYLLFFIPPWAHEGGPDELLARLAHRETRDRMRTEILDSPFPPQPHDTYTYVRPESKNAWVMGRTFQEVGEHLGMHWLDAMLRLLYEEELEVGFKGGPPEDPDIWDQLNRDFLELISREDYMVGSDSIPTGVAPHPRAYGTFPRFLRLAREYGFPSLATIVRRMTAIPAERFGLKDRGILARGKAADIVVFNWETVSDRATYENPTQYSVGIEYVLVNGQIAWRDGQPTGILAGRALSA